MLELGCDGLEESGQYGHNKNKSDFEFVFKSLGCQKKTKMVYQTDSKCFSPSHYIVQTII